MAVAAACLVGALAPASAGAIVGGGRLAVRQAPWLVQVRHDGDASCTGTLVRPRIVLTAGHCLLDDLPTSVAVGRQRTESSDGEVIAVGRYGISRAYLANQLVPSAELRHDVALLELRRAPTAPRTVRLAGTADARAYRPGHRAQAAGWGLAFGSSRRTDLTLRRVTLTVRSRGTCRDVLARRGLSATTLLCAGRATTPSRGVCSGDSGGPLYRGGLRAPRQLAVTSAVSSASCRRAIGIFVPVNRGQTRRWIDAAVRQSEEAMRRAATRSPSRSAPRPRTVVGERFAWLTRERVDGSRRPR